jgi:hypothetical protein
VSYGALFEVPPWPFAARTLSGPDWLLWIALASGPLLLFDARLGRFAPAARVLIGSGVIAMVLQAMARHHWETMVTVVWFAGLGLLLFVAWLAAARLGRRRSGATLPLVLLVTATGLAVSAGLTGSAKLGQVTGILCAGLGATGLLAWWRPGFRLTTGDVTHTIVILFGLGLSAFFFSGLPAVDALLIASAPAAAWLGERPALGLRTPAQRTALRVLAAAVPVAIAVTHAALAFQLDPYADDY